MNAIELKPVPFHGDTLYLAEKDGEPYTPAKTFCDNLGLSWQPQHRKLLTAPKRWSVTMMMIETAAGPREAVFIKVRKLPAWLLSIDPRKCAPAVRERLELYQEECDEVLYRYWKDGFAANPRVADPEPSIPASAMLALQGEVIALQRFKLRVFEEGWKPRPRKASAPVKMTNEIAARCYDLHAKGESLRGIARITGISETQLSYFFRHRPSLPFHQN